MVRVSLHPGSRHLVPGRPRDLPRVPVLQDDGDPDLALVVQGGGRVLQLHLRHPAWAAHGAPSVPQDDGGPRAAGRHPIHPVHSVAGLVGLQHLHHGDQGVQLHARAHLRAGAVHRHRARLRAAERQHGGAIRPVRQVAPVQRHGAALLPRALPHAHQSAQVHPLQLVGVDVRAVHRDFPLVVQPAGNQLVLDAAQLDGLAALDRRQLPAPEGLQRVLEKLARSHARQLARDA
mmetsp:Transcript_24276/g.60312  ORF Transcript_24276/g.60312 Transcript_24276/m.60312 type:complete len:233 (-) Transcript_24276:1093-1791(-)